MRTIAYIDGFNLYNRALIKDPDCKWLDVHKLCAHLLDAKHILLQTKYYTARVSGRRDPHQPTRQNAYFRALKEHAGTQIFYGSFMTKRITRPLVRPIAGLPKYVEVDTTEEKGSDVNLACHLVWDAASGEADAAVVISKDTDLVEPIRIVVEELNKPVILLCPDEMCPSKLREVASTVLHIRRSHLLHSQMPNIIHGKNGKQIHRPHEWHAKPLTKAASAVALE